MSEALSRYLGTHVPANSADFDIYLNEIYTVVQFELPSIFFRNPRAFLKPRTKNYIVKRRDPVTGKNVEEFRDSAKSAKTQEHILNYTIEKMGYKRQVRRVLLDALLFRYGVLWHGYKGEFGMTEEQSYFIESEETFVERLSLKNFLFDPKVSLCDIDKARWVGRSFDVLADDLRSDDSLFMEKAIRGKKGFAQELKRAGGLDTKTISSRKTLLDLTDDKYKKTAEFFRVYEIFRRPTPAEKRDGGKGNVLLLIMEQERPLRDNPWPYKTRSWPAEILQFNEIPDTKFGMSDIEVYGQIADHKNLIFNLQIRNAESNSKAIVGYDKSGMDEETVHAIEDGSQNIIGFDGDPRSKISIQSLASVASSELYALDGRIQANLDEKSGVTDLKKGNLRTGEESATSVQIRNAGTASRFIFRQDLMMDFLRSSFKRLNDYNQQFMPIKDAVRIMGSLDIEWSDKPSKEEIQADIDVEIDPISMLPENPQKEMEELRTILSLMTEALSNPIVYQKIQTEGKMFNLSPIIESLLSRLKINNPDVFRGIRPEEAKGFASVAELEAAYSNVSAILSGQQPPSPPAEEQDHAVRIAVYQASAQIAQQLGNEQAVAIISELIQIQQAIAEGESQVKQPKEGSRV